MKIFKNSTFTNKNYELTYRICLVNFSIPIDFDYSIWDGGPAGMGYSEEELLNDGGWEEIS